MTSGTVKITRSFSYKVEPKVPGVKSVIWIKMRGLRWVSSNVVVPFDVTKKEVEKIIKRHSHISIFKSIYPA